MGSARLVRLQTRRLLSSVTGAGLTFAARVDRLLTPQRMRIYPAIFVILGLASLVINVAMGHIPLTLSGQPLTPDYLAHWTGGKLLLKGDMGHLYDPSVQLELQRGVIGGSTSLSWFVSPPFTAVLYAPLALLPYPLSAGVWIISSTAMLVGALALLRPMLPRLSRQNWGLVILVLAASQPVFELIGGGQDSALSVLLWVSGIRLLTQKRDWAAGVVFALGLFKPQLFILAPVVLLLQHRIRALGAWVVTTSGLALASAALVGPAGIKTWLSLPFTQLYQVQVQEGQASKMQGLPSLLVTLFPTEISGIAQIVGMVIAIVLMAGFVLAVRSAPAPSINEVWAFAAVTTVLASPHLVIYDLVLAVPAFLYLLEWHDQRVTRLSLLLLFAITWTTAIRHVAAQQLPWPLAVVGGAWSAVPLFVLWALQYRNLRPFRARQNQA
jgi:hypothetical protein